MTDASSWMLRMALPSSSAMESTTIFSQRRFSAPSGMESVTISLRERALLDPLDGVAGEHGVRRGGQHLARARVLEGLRPPWPGCPPVSTMSSTISAVRPSTSPITWWTSATLGWSRRLSTMARVGVEPLGVGARPLHAARVGRDHGQAWAASAWRRSR